MTKVIRLFPRAVLLVIIFIVAGAGLMNVSWGGEKNQSPVINCDIQNQACIQNLLGQKVTLDVTPKPVKAMAELTFHVRLTGQPPQQIPHIDLGMPGMKMGPNRVYLKPAGRNSFIGRGVIVRCPSGRTVWRATVTVPE